MVQSPDSWDSAKQEALDKGLATHFFTVSEVRDARMAVCKGCDRLGMGSFCKECNCYMPIKTWVEAATCPKNKWAK